MTAPRWPLHPRPGPVEALSSWLGRTARLYGLTAEDLLRHNLGSASFALAGLGDLDLDWDPPGEVLAALGERTGLGLHELRPMTMAGWVPWLTDTLSLDDGQAVFDTYVRQYSVLLRPGEAGQNQVKKWRPWLPAREERRACPACAADPGRGLVLMWRVPLMSSCAEHGCQLEPEPDVRFAALAGNPVEPEAAAAATAALDRLTFQALTAGRSACPGDPRTPGSGSGCCAPYWTS
jgi:TniQ